jgi:colanic acid/amylovoran biosynthesis glycosyltransferase
MSRDLPLPTTKKSRLVLVLATFPKLSETFLVSKFLGLLDAGWDVHIVCHQFNREAWAQFPKLTNQPALKQRVHQSWPSQPHWLAALLFLPALISTFVKATRQTWRYGVHSWQRFGWGVLKHFYQDAALIALKPDILHFEFGALAVGKTYLKEFLDTKLSVSFRGYDLNFAGIADPDYYQGLWQAVDKYHILSHYLRERALARGCPSIIKYYRIPPAIDLSDFPMHKSITEGNLGTYEKPLKVISVGRLEWKKGYEHALQAINILKDSGIIVKYRIIGGGDYQPALYFARHQLGLEETVTFLGAMPHENVIDQLIWADVFLHPSLSEGFCNAVLEAQAISLPVVCTDAGGLPENVLDGVTGFVVPRRDPSTMAEKLILLADDSILRQHMGAAGRVRVAAHFCLADQIAAFEEFYAAL